MTRLIFGCGYLGLRVAQRWLARGDDVTAVTRRPERTEELAKWGIRPLVADVTRPETLRELPDAETVLYAVGFDPAGGHCRWDVYVDGLKNVLDELSLDTRRIIAISSTGVYGQTDGSWVDEDSPCRPRREAGKAFVAAEQMLADHALGNRAVVLRMAGLYGPGRIPRRADIAAGKPMGIPADNYLNLIHVDDAADAVLAAEERAPVPRTYLVCDGRPVDRREFFTALAQLLGVASPPFVEPSPEVLATHHMGSNKRVGNARLVAELDFRPKYPSYIEGLTALVGAESK